MLGSQYPGTGREARNHSGPHELKSLGMMGSDQHLSVCSTLDVESVRRTTKNAPASRRGLFVDRLELFYPVIRFPTSMTRAGRRAIFVVSLKGLVQGSWRHFRQSWKKRL